MPKCIPLQSTLFTTTCPDYTHAQRYVVTLVTKETHHRILALMPTGKTVRKYMYPCPQKAVGFCFENLEDLRTNVQAILRQVPADQGYLVVWDRQKTQEPNGLTIAIADMPPRMLQDLTKTHPLHGPRTLEQMMENDTTLTPTTFFVPIKKSKSSSINMPLTGNDNLLVLLRDTGTIAYASPQVIKELQLPAQTPTLLPPKQSEQETKKITPLQVGKLVIRRRRSAAKTKDVKAILAPVQQAPIQVQKTPTPDRRKIKIKIRINPNKCNHS